MIILQNMKRLRNWVCHRNKIPIDPKTGNPAKSNDPNTWGTYEQAKEWMERDKSISGLGFMFGNSPYVGIDIDHCIQDGKTSELAHKIITTFQSYTEISPSGTGVHIICKGKLKGTGRKNSELGLEIYDTGRYFTVTENAIKAYPNVLECQKEIDELCQKYFSEKSKATSKSAQTVPKQQQICHLEDEKLLEIARNSRNGTKFADLYAGNWQNYYKSQSEADIALCNMLAFWTGNDFDQIDRIFRSSGLMRDKWNQQHGINTYGDMTITKAVDTCEETFQPSQMCNFNDIKKVETRTETVQSGTESVQSGIEWNENSKESVQNGTEISQNGTESSENGTETVQNDTKSSENGTETNENNSESAQNDTPTFQNLDRFHRFNGKGQITGVFDAKIRDYIIETEHIIVVGGCTYLYKNGVYLLDKQGHEIKNIIQSLIYMEFQNARTINRVYDLILLQKCLQKNYYEVNQYPNYYINFQNGMLNVKTLELLPHSPDYFSMNQIPHNWKMLAVSDYLKDHQKCQNSLHFLNTSFIKEDTKTIFQYLGLCMTHNMDYQMFLLLLGEGANGKSVLIDLFNAIIGSENISSLSMGNLTQRFFSSQLLFKLCNTCADISKISIEDDAELKKVIGGDTLQAEFKGKDSFVFAPYAKFLFSANRFPHVDDRSNGFKRRLRVVEMNQNPPKKDVHLKEKLMKELDFWISSAVLWLQQALQKQDIYESENSKKARQKIHKDSDSVYAFVHDCLERFEGHDMPRSEMFQEYDKYCIQNERVRVKKKTFFDEMTAKGFVTKKDRIGVVVYTNVHIKICNDDFDYIVYRGNKT